MAKVILEFDVPETTDKCWAPDGVQCLYDAVLKHAHHLITMRAAKPQDAVMNQHYQRQLAVITSITVNGVKMFD